MACIGIDCRFISAPVGIGTYTHNVVPRLVSHLSAHHCVLFVHDTTSLEQELPTNTTVVKVHAPHYSLREQLELPFRLRQLSVDLYFSPHFNVPLRCPCPFVVTIHDLILHRYPNYASALKKMAYRTLMHHAVRKASHCIAVSHFTAQEVSSTYSNTSPITVITEGVDPVFQPCDQKQQESVLERYGLEPEYFLYVGGAKQHKNLQALIDAHASLNDSSILLLVTSGPELSLLSLHPQVRILSNVDTKDLSAIYSAARCFVTPSLYEGFCLPILEARACGCPIIASNTSAIPEVAGPNTLLVEPTVDAIRAALQAPPEKSDPVPEKHNWDHIAAETATILTASLDG